jgi:hypothetical protein
MCSVLMPPNLKNNGKKVHKHQFSILVMLAAPAAAIQNRSPVC